MIIIKKYKNRRFYNSSHSCYIRLPEIQKLVQDGEQIQVLSHPEGDDLTKQFLFEMVLEKTNLLGVLPISWLENLARVAGVEEEKVVLAKLQGIFEESPEQSFLSPEVAILEEESSSEGPGKTDLVEYVDDPAKGIPIQLEPEDLLELNWEEHSDTEEVEDTQVSIQDWDDNTVERIEWSTENTVETMEEILQDRDSEELLVDVIEKTAETIQMREQVDRVRERIVLPAEENACLSEEVPDEEKEQDTIFEFGKTEVEDRRSVDVEKALIVEAKTAPVVVETTVVSIAEGEPSHEEIPVESAIVQQDASEEKALSQKELLQAKLAALKAKLGQR